MLTFTYLSYAYVSYVFYVAGVVNKDKINNYVKVYIVLLFLHFLCISDCQFVLTWVRQSHISTSDYHGT